MASDLRYRHDESLRLQAARLHDAGLGRRAIGARLGVPHEAVRGWLEKYRAGGTELLLKMDGKINYVLTVSCAGPVAPRCARAACEGMTS